MELIINVDEKLVCEGFERPFTEEERNVLIRAIGNGRPYNPSEDAISRSWVEHNVLSLMDVETRIYAKARLDNAPPVEQSEIWGEGFTDGLATGAKWVGRPKGEWKRITEETANIQMFLCSVCGRKVEVGYSHISPSVYYPFCHCGADMRTEDK